MKVKTVQQLIGDIYHFVDRSRVFADLEPKDKGAYLECICPACGHRRAFVYKYGKVLKCNRINKCRYQATLIQYVAGCKKPRNEAFKAAVRTLAGLARIAVNSDGHYVLPSRVKSSQSIPRLKFKVRPELEPELKKMQQKFGKYATSYLAYRGIPVNLARAFGAGFAPYGDWPHYTMDPETGKRKPCRQWRPGRVVFPIRNTEGGLINLYGRAATKKCPKKMRHTFLPGPKGIFNQRVLAECESVFIVEGYLDALSMIAAGHENTAAVFQVGGIPWNLIKSRSICFGFDPDQYESRPFKQALDEGVRIGKKVFYLSKEIFEGHVDLNHLWSEKRRINIRAVNYN